MNFKTKSLFFIPICSLILVALFSCNHPTTPAVTYNSIIITEKEFKQNKLFFLDTAYKSFYLGRRASVPAVKSEKLQVWISNDNVKRDIKDPMVSYYDIYRYFDSTRTVYKLLKMNRDYVLDNRWSGVIRFDSISVDESDIVGIHLETEDSSIIPNKGVYCDTSDTAKVITGSLWALKPLDQDSSSPSFPLMWRNIYTLPVGIDLARFALRVVRLPDTTNERTPDGRLFSEVLGLSDVNGQAFVNNNQIFDLDRLELIVPPYDSSSHGNEPFSNPALGAYNTNPRIYRWVGMDFYDIVPRYRIVFLNRLGN